MRFVKVFQRNRLHIINSVYVCNSNRDISAPAFICENEFYRLCKAGSWVVQYTVWGQIRKPGFRKAEGIRIWKVF